MSTPNDDPGYEGDHASVCFCDRCRAERLVGFDSEQTEAEATGEDESAEDTI